MVRAFTGLPLGLGVAPMEGVTGFPMRLWLHLASAPATQATPFLRVTPTFPARALPREFAPELDELAGLLPYRLVFQMMAAEPDDFLRTAELAAPRAVPFFELNCGCPSPTCVGKGAGSSLLREAAVFHEVVRGLADRLGPGRLAVKMRTGFHDAAEFPALAAGLARLPLARLTVHGRTRADGYTGKARWDLIARAAKETLAPVVASGDVVDAASLARLRAAAPEAAGVIVGRGALRNPWVFAELRTGAPVKVTIRAVVEALASFAVLHELWALELEKTHALVKDGVFGKSLGTDEAKWARLRETLAEALAGARANTDGAAIPASPDTRHWPVVSRAALGRAKMVWSYLRSSLPSPLFEPRVLRAADLPGLLDAILRVAAEHGLAEGELPLLHDPAKDWIYSGSRKAGGDKLAASC